MSFNCLPNCGKCCGIVPLQRHVYEHVMDRAMVPYTEVPDLNIDTGEKIVWAIGRDGRCAFLNRETMACNIYEYRPPVCVEFGTGDAIRIACPYVTPDGRMRKRANTRHILKNTPHRLLRIE